MDTRLFLKVECRVDERGEPVPTTFALGGRRIQVAAILDAWFGRDHRYFKIHGEDDRVYLLRHDIPSGEWELTLFEQP